jgi:hypothetical protein
VKIKLIQDAVRQKSITDSKIASLLLNLIMFCVNLLFQMEVDGVSSGSEAGTPAPPSPLPVASSKGLKSNAMATVPPAK